MVCASPSPKASASTLPRPTHYTEEPSRLSTTRSTAFVRVQGGGFVTREMLEATVEELRQAALDARLGALLVDLRAVTGYETACLFAVDQFLREAPALGVHRIGVVATSSVLRTALGLAAHAMAMVVELRTFEHERAALQWLHPVAPRPRNSSSSTAAAAP